MTDDFTDIDIEFILFGSKYCPTCGRKLPASTEFWHKDRDADDGLSNQCAECRNVVRAKAAS